MESNYGKARTVWLRAPEAGIAVMMPVWVSNVKYFSVEVLILRKPGVTDMLNIEEMYSRKCQLNNRTESKNRGVLYTVSNSAHLESLKVNGCAMNDLGGS